MSGPKREDYEPGEEGFLLWSMDRKHWLRNQDREDRLYPFIKEIGPWFYIRPIPLIKTKRAAKTKKGQNEAASATEPCSKRPDDSADTPGPHSQVAPREHPDCAGNTPAPVSRA